MHHCIIAFGRTAADHLAGWRAGRPSPPRVRREWPRVARRAERPRADSLVL